MGGAVGMHISPFASSLDRLKEPPQIRTPDVIEREMFETWFSWQSGVERHPEMRKCTKSVFLLIQGEFGCFDFFPLLLLADDVEQKDPWCQANAHKHFLLFQVQIQVKKYR